MRDAVSIQSWDRKLVERRGWRWRAYMGRWKGKPPMRINVSQLGVNAFHRNAALGETQCWNKTMHMLQHLI